jgi:hypothetical protein
MAEQTLEEKTKKACIYGKEIFALCPVREELGKSDPLQRWKIPKTELLGEARELIDSFGQSLGIEARALHEFCETCPHIELYYWQAIYQLQLKGKVKKDK